MYYTDGNHHTSGYLSRLRELSGNQVSMMETLAFVSIPLKLGGCTTQIEIIVKWVIWAVHSNFWKMSFLLTQYRKCVLCWYSAKTYKMYYRHQSHDNTGDFSCSRHLLENRAFQWPIVDKVRSASYRTKPAKCTTRMEITIKLVTWTLQGSFQKTKLLSDA